jgi:four helix bundle protein
LLIANLLEISSGMACPFMSRHESDCRTTEGTHHAFCSSHRALLPDAARHLGRPACPRSTFRAGTGVAANYHATCRARSHRDFVPKLGIVVEESDETVFWLTFTGEVGLNHEKERQELLVEARELLAIFTQSAKTAIANRH